MTKNLKLEYLLMALGFVSCQSEQKQAAAKPNVLFIAVDDLRPQLGCYGQRQIKSPNMDKLAAIGLTFINAYCNVPVCGASRASLLTGIRPTQNRFVGYNTYAQDDAPGAVSLPQHFRNNGYHTISNGKIFHHINDIPESWSEKPWNPAAESGSFLNYLTDRNQQIVDSTKGRAYPYEMAEVEDEAYFDGQIAAKTIEDLKRLKDEGKPFFLASGFLKPHLPFNAPKKYWDLYPPETISLPDNYFPPRNAPDAAIHNFGELRNYYGVPAEGPVSDEMALELIHGYYACVSYVDAQIGKVLDALEELGLAENTVIILWGDHGWQLGEHSIWCKHANFKTSLNAPLIISAPGFRGNQKTEALVEFIDIFPSLCELAQLENPAQLHGKSFVPLMENPGQQWKEAVYCRYVLGESIKTKDYLYTEWFNKQQESFASMLFDHQQDPDENVNVAGEAAFSGKVAEFQQLLQEQIKQREEY
jgi:arylsulfatase A-like enzyme